METILQPLVCVKEAIRKKHRQNKSHYTPVRMNGG